MFVSNTWCLSWIVLNEMHLWNGLLFHSFLHSASRCKFLPSCVQTRAKLTCTGRFKVGPSAGPLWFMNEHRLYDGSLGPWPAGEGSHRHARCHPRITVAFKITPLLRQAALCYNLQLHSEGFNVLGEISQGFSICFKTRPIGWRKLFSGQLGFKGDLGFFFLFFL